MNTSMNISSHPGEINEPPNIQPDDVVLNAAEPAPRGTGPQNTASQLLPPTDPTYYLAEDEVGPGDSTAFVTPFQISAPLPVVQGAQPAGADWAAYPPPAPLPTQPGKASKKSPHLLRITIIVLVSIVTLSILWVTVFAQPMQPFTTRGATIGVLPTARATVHVQQTPMKTASVPTPTPTTAAGPSTGSWVPQQLPAGWVTAGLTSGDALFAERTAWTFTDREEGLDFRNVGTRAAHGGTFTAAVFILSPGGRQRFQNNDVRVADNTLFDHVETVQLIQSAVNATPTLVQFQTQGNIAWVDVSFELYQEQASPNNPQQRMGGLEMGQGTNQPIIHHMSVLLVRVTPGTQGNNAPMGGTGWLVSNYGLDLPNGAPSLALQQPL